MMAELLLVNRLDDDDGDAMGGDDLAAANKRFKRLRSHRGHHQGSVGNVAAAAAAAASSMGGGAARNGVGGRPLTPLEADAKARQEDELTEMIFLRDLHFGFLPDDCETEFARCFRKLSQDAKFATKVGI